MTHIETIPCKAVTTDKGVYGYLPTRPIQLRPGDYANRVTRGKNVFIEIHRASFLKRLWHTAKEYRL